MIYFSLFRCEKWNEWFLVEAFPGCICGGSYAGQACQHTDEDGSAWHTQYAAGLYGERCAGIGSWYRVCMPVIKIYFYQLLLNVTCNVIYPSSEQKLYKFDIYFKQRLQMYYNTGRPVCKRLSCASNIIQWLSSDRFPLIILLLLHVNPGASLVTW